MSSPAGSSGLSQPCALMGGCQHHQGYNSDSSHVQATLVEEQHAAAAQTGRSVLFMYFVWGGVSA